MQVSQAEACGRCRLPKSNETALSSQVPKCLWMIFDNKIGSAKTKEMPAAAVHVLGSYTDQFHGVTCAFALLEARVRPSLQRVILNPIAVIAFVELGVPMC